MYASQVIGTAIYKVAFGDTQRFGYGIAVSMMPCCFAAGQAAGTAAAVCATEGKVLRGIPMDRLQEVLRQQGAYL